MARFTQPRRLRLPPWLLLLVCLVLRWPWRGGVAARAGKVPGAEATFCLQPLIHPRPAAIASLRTAAAPARLCSVGVRQPVARGRPARAAADAAAAAAAAAPAIGVVVGAAATVSALQLSRAFSGDRDAVATEEGFFGASRWQGRTVGIFLVWAAFIGYAFLLAPGQTPEAKAQDAQLLQVLLSTPFDGSVAALFVAVFNSLGIWPVIYAATLLPGAARQAPVPAWPFVGGSFALGAFALSPYLALREYRGGRGSAVEDDLDWITRYWLEGRINAVLLLAGAAYLALYALGNGTIGVFAPAEAWTAFLPVFMGSLTPHVSCVDFMVLWMFYAPVLLEDGRRRGMFSGPFESWVGSEKSLFALCAGLPVFGGCAWLLLRPPLAGREG